MGKVKGIKPCPWCKSDQLMHLRGEVGNLHWVHCHTCKAEGPVAMDWDEAKALWDNREAAGISDIEDHPKFEAFIRAFWRRIEAYKNKYDKELPEEIPVEFKASMATAFLALGVSRPEEKRHIDIDQFVNRFLSWPLPESVNCDLCTSIPRYKWRTGTNLLTATEAKQMIEHIIGRG